MMGPMLGAPTDPAPGPAPGSASGAASAGARASGLVAWGPDRPAAITAIALVALAWVVLKVLAGFAWVILPGEYGDTYYYLLRAQEAAASGTGVLSVFREYPTPAGLLLLLPWVLGADDPAQYRAAVIAMTTVADAAFTILLGRRTGPAGVFAWILCTTVLGQLVLLRFDVFPAVVAGAAVLFALQGQQRTAAVLVALGTGLKAWPVVLAPLTLGVRDRTRAAVAFVATGTALVVLSLLVADVGRLLSPLGYQRDRGLQIESVPATVPMVTWSTDTAYRVYYGSFAAYEVTGPGVPGWLRIADAAALVGLAVCALLLALWFWRGTPRGAIGYLALAFVATFVVTSRALSPQYLLWLAAPAVVMVGVAVHEGHRRDRGGVWATFGALVVLCLLTTAIYPTFYNGLWQRSDRTSAALGFLVWRNVGLLAFTAWVMVLAAWTTLRPAAPEPVEGASTRSASVP